MVSHFSLRTSETIIQKLWLCVKLTDYTLFLVPECVIWIITCTMLHYVVRQKGTWMKILTKWYKFLLFFYFFYGFCIIWFLGLACALVKQKYSCVYNWTEYTLTLVPEYLIGDHILLIKEFLLYRYYFFFFSQIWNKT